MSPIYENIKHKMKSRGGEPILFYCKEDTDIEPGAVFGPVIRDVFVIECQTEGYATIEINGNRFNLKPGDCYAILPGQLTTLISDTEHPRRGFFCILGGSRVGDVLAKVGISDKTPFAPREAFERVVEIIKEMIDIKNDIGTGAELKRTSLVYDMLSALHLGKSQNDKSLWLEKTFGLFEMLYQDGVSVSDIANSVGFDRCYFSSVFKQHTGMTPHKYLCYMRIEKACQLLRETNASVAEISKSVGIEPSNFARTFKAEMGMGPLQYKKKNAKKADKN